MKSGILFALVSVFALSASAPLSQIDVSGRGRDIQTFRALLEDVKDILFLPTPADPLEPSEYRFRYIRAFLAAADILEAVAVANADVKVEGEEHSVQDFQDVIENLKKLVIEYGDDWEIEKARSLYPETFELYLATFYLLDEIVLNLRIAIPDAESVVDILNYARDAEFTSDADWQQLEVPEGKKEAFEAISEVINGLMDDLEGNKANVWEVAFATLQARQQEAEAA